MLLPEEGEVDGNENTVGILWILEALHRLEPRLHPADVILQSIGRCGDAFIKEVLKREFRRAHEPAECLEEDVVDAEDVVFQVPLEMMETLIERPCILLPQEMAAVAIQDALGSIAGGVREPAELEPCAEIPEQVHMTPLRQDFVFRKHLPQPMQTIGRGSFHHHPTDPQQPEHAIIDRRGFLAGVELPGDETCLDVPDQVLTVLLSADGEPLAVRDDDAGGGERVDELQIPALLLQTPDGRYMAAPLALTNPTVGAPIEQIHIVDVGLWRSARFVDAEGMFADCAEAASTAVPYYPNTPAMGTLFFMEKLGKE